MLLNNEALYWLTLNYKRENILDALHLSLGTILRLHSSSLMSCSELPFRVIISSHMYNIQSLIRTALPKSVTCVYSAIMHLFLDWFLPFPLPSSSPAKRCLPYTCLCLLTSLKVVQCIVFAVFHDLWFSVDCLIKNSCTLLMVQPKILQKDAF